MEAATQPLSQEKKHQNDTGVVGYVATLKRLSPLNKCINYSNICMFENISNYRIYIFETFNTGIAGNRFIPISKNNTAFTLCHAF